MKMDNGRATFDVDNPNMAMQAHGMYDDQQVDILANTQKRA